MKRIIIPIISVLILSFYLCSEKKDPTNPYSSSYDPAKWMPQDLKIKQKNIHTVELSWEQAEGNIDGFMVDKKAGNGDIQPSIDTLKLREKSYTDTSAVPNKKNTYWVYAYADKNRSKSVSDNITIEFPAPTGLTVEQRSINEVTIYWDDISEGEDGYIIDRKEGVNNWHESFALLEDNSKSWTDTSIKVNNEYSYRLYAYKGNQTSEKIDTNITVEFNPPTELALHQISETGIKLTWQDNSNGEDGFIIERKNIDWKEIDSVKNNINGFIDNELTYGESYTYRVKAYVGEYESIYSNIPSEIEMVVPAPTNIKTYVINYHTIEIKWEDNCNFEDGYKIDRKKTGDIYKEIADINSNTISFIDSNLVQNTQYTYRVYTYSNNHKSDYLESDQINTDNTSPLATFLVTPSSGNTNTSFRFDATGCSDAEDDLSDLQIRWDFDNNGEWEIDYSTNKIVNYQYDSAATYIAKMEVKDLGGMTNIDTQTIEVREIAEKGLVAYYPFNGNANDKSGYGNDGNVYGAQLSRDRFGVDNNSYNFDGIDDEIKVESHSNLPFNDSPRTIALWVKPSDNTDSDALISFGDGLTNNRRMSINIRDQQIGIIREGSTNDFKWFGQIPLNEWSFIAVSYNGDKSDLYIDNNLIDNDDRPYNVDSSKPLMIGTNTDNRNDEYFNSSIDEVRVYNKALSKLQIDSLYNLKGWPIEDNSQPEPFFTFSPDSGNINTEFTFDATSSSDTEDNTADLQVRWDWENDGIWDTNYSTNKIITHQFDSAGVYSIKLEVKDTDGLAADTTRNLKISESGIENEMVYVEGGTFTMGDVWGDGQSDETPTHEVTVSSFYMSEYEVNHVKFIEFLNSKGVSSDGSYNGNEIIDMDASDCAISHDGISFYFDSNDRANDERCPIIEVTWYGACQYCNWKSEQEGFTKTYSINSDSIICKWENNGYRLPTEAEWEYAARSGGRNDRKYSGTNDINELESYAWYNDNDGLKTKIVGTKKPNDLGLYDMAGNVWEWCWDWYEGDYYSKSPSSNPTGPLKGTERIFKGGTWHAPAFNCRTSMRAPQPPDFSHIRHGFRIIRSGGFSVNTPPNASFTISPDSGYINTEFTFDASSCSDLEDNNSNLQVRWDWENDGIWDTEYTTSKIVKHQYNTIGKFTIKLEVIDSDGLTDQVSMQVKVSSRSEKLVLDLPFNGNADDLSSNNNHGVANGAKLTNDRFGNDNSAYSFDGIDDYIELNQSLPDAEELAISVWIKYTGQNEGTIFMDATPHPGNDFILNADSSSIGIRADKNEANLCLVHGAINNIDLYNSWHHIVWNMKQSYSNLYIDGLHVKTISDSGSNIGYHADRPSIGRWWDENQNKIYFKGKIDDFKLYDGTIFKATIDSLYLVNDWNQVQNTKPFANFTIIPDSGNTQTDFTFDASGCSDAENDISELQVRWDFENDGTWDTNYSTTKSIIHSFSDTGSYTVKLEVKDSGDLTDQTTKQINVSNSSIQNEMAYVEGGTYTMGDVWGDGYGNETPTHEVTVSSFYMSKYEVTHADYIEFLNSRGVSSDGSYNGNELIDMDASYCAISHDGSSFYFDGSSYAGNEQFPVIEVTWYGAAEYCNWLSEQEGLTKAYTISSGSISCNWNADGYRLPTEAEWEYVARSGGRDDRKWSGTNSESDLGDYAWYSSNSGSETHPVGTKQPNDLGIYDMSGNVWEWCWDWYDSDYYSDSPSNNPTGPSSGSYRVLRGGCWRSNSHSCRTAYRGSNYPTDSNYPDGFRLLRTQ